MFRKPKKNLKGKFRSRKRTKENEDDDDDPNKRLRGDDDDDDVDADADEQGTSTSEILQQIRNEKKKKKGVRFIHNGDEDHNDDGGIGAKKSKAFMQQYDATENKPSDKELATRTAQHHPEERPQSSSSADNDDANPTQEDPGGKKLYKGSKTTRNKFLAGPLKAPTFVRTTSRFDYQPDICKDFKETGFCGFGDTCIYLHDRGNTMSGWQLEAEYEKKKKAAQDAKEREMDMFCKVISGGDGGDELTGLNGDEEGSSSSSDGLPFACFLCRGAFKDPVVTSCAHYFCQNCIMQHVKENSKTAGSGASASTSSACPVCQKDTHGVFNYPSKLHAKLRRMEGCETWQDFFESSKT